MTVENHKFRRRMPPNVVLGVCAALGACVGPNFHRPAPPSVERYTVEPLPAATASAAGPGGAAQRFLTDQDVPRDWWKLFGSEEIDALVNEALRANPDVLSAQAALRQALENTAAQRGSLLSDRAGQFRRDAKSQCRRRACAESRLRHGAL